MLPVTAIKPKSVMASPVAGQRLAAGPVTIRGAAWAGQSPVARGIPPVSAPIALATPGAFGKVRVEVGSGAPDCRPHRPSPSPTRERERDKMTRWGADVKPEDRPEVTDFLTSHVQAAQVSYYTIRRAAPRPG